MLDTIGNVLLVTCFGALGLIAVGAVVICLHDMWAAWKISRGDLKTPPEYKEPKELAPKCPFCHKTESKDKPHTKCTEKAAATAKKQLLKTFKELNRSDD